MNVMYLLTPKCNTAFVYDNYTVKQVIDCLQKNGYTAVPIIDAEGRFIGSITEGDLLTLMEEVDTLSIRDTRKIPIKSINRRMDNNAVRIDSDMDTLMEMAFIQNYVPVVDDDNVFIGIVTRKTIMEYLYNVCRAENEGEVPITKVV